MRTVDFKGREARDLRSTFGDLPLVEATEAMIVYVSRAEMDHSVRGDPHNCMFSNACKRAFGSQAVLFYPTVAYVDMLDENGERIVMRFKVSAKTRGAIERFDLAAGKQVEATFKLNPVGKSQRLATQSKQRRLRLKAQREGRRMINENRSAGGKKAARTRRNRELMGLRVGSPT